MPIAKPDHARTLRGVPVVIAVIANDEGSNLSIGGYTLPPAGSLVLNPDQSFTYTPAVGFVGTDGFAYTVRDQLGGTVPRRGHHRRGAAELDADGCERQRRRHGRRQHRHCPCWPTTTIRRAIRSPSSASTRRRTARSRSSRTSRSATTPQAGFAGIDSFTYTVGDGAGAVSTANVTVAVTLPNAPPLARPDQAATIAGTAVTIDALANDNDPEGGPDQPVRHEPAGPWRSDAHAGSSLRLHARRRLRRRRRLQLHDPRRGGRQQHRDRDRGRGAAELGAGGHVPTVRSRPASRWSSTRSPTTATPTAIRCASRR